MSFKINFYSLLFVCFISLVSCEPEDIELEEIPNITSGVYILNEGLWDMNNSSISFLDLTTNKVNKDIFTSVNNRGLGDTGNGLGCYDQKMYVVVSGSNLIEVIDISTAKSITQIKFNKNEKGNTPRQICFFAGKAYVSCFDGYICKINTISLEIEGYLKVGRNPEGICVANNKLYVANSGGLDEPNYDNTVSVIDINTFTEVKKITVSENPYTIASNSLGYVYVSSRNDYASDLYKFQKIDSETDELVKVYEDISVLNFCISDNYIYMYNYNFDTGKHGIQVLDANTDTIVNENFISDNTKMQTPYGIGVNPYSGDVYIADAFNFMVQGEVFCFDKLGKLKFSERVGLNPQSFMFIDEN